MTSTRNLNTHKTTPSPVGRAGVEVASAKTTASDKPHLHTPKRSTCM